MKDRYWYRLLSNWHQQGNDGLTITYLIGSQTFLPVDIKHQTISQLLQDLASNQECNVFIRTCMNLGDLIFGIKNDKKKNMPGVFLLDSNGKETSLFLGKFDSEIGKTIAEVCDYFEERYQPYIDQKRYSLNNRERGHFSAEEVRFIKSCFYDRAGL